MTRRTAPKRSPKPSNLSTVVRWEFTRGDERVSCQIERDLDTGIFAVALVKCLDLERASLETFRAGVAAFRRHAILATALRASGWKLAAYTS